jgi:hypothetical protein
LNEKYAGCMLNSKREKAKVCEGDEINSTDLAFL